MNSAAHWTNVALAAALAGSVAQGQTTERVSVATSGAQGNQDCNDPSISADGRFVAFWSGATSLVAGGTNGAGHIFVHDRQSRTTELVSLDSSGAQGNMTSLSPSISADGRFVTFSSGASNLVSGDTNGRYDVFVRDRRSGTTERLSVGPGGVEGDNDSIFSSISADGRFVAFPSSASNLVTGDTNGRGDVFVHDRQSGTNELASVDSGGAQASNNSWTCSISADGRFVAITSSASDLVAGDTNEVEDVFVRDRQSGTTERISVDSGGAQGNSWSRYPSISEDGRYVAFHSWSTNLVSGDTNGTWDVFLRDRWTGTTERVSVNTGRTQGDGQSFSASISTDGHFVAFESESSNLVAADTNGTRDIFVRHILSGTTERVSVGSSGGQGNGPSGQASISTGGRFVAFMSRASTFVVGDTNQREDVFVRDRGFSPPPSPFCFGDGGGTACPCGNNGTAGNGCASSVNANGANLGASGNASLANDTLVLVATGMPDSTCLYFQGASQTSVPFGDGLRCVAGAISRLGTKFNVGGASQYPVGSDPPVSMKGNVTAPGTRTYQVWYPNVAAFCTAATFNFTNGLEVTWAP